MGTLPKSLTMELAVKTKINDPAVVEERRKLTAEHTPMELGNIGSLADFPIPTPISNLFNKPAADTPEKPKRKKNMEEKRKRNLTTGTFLSSDFLPQSWLDTKLVCRTKVEEDPEVLAKRQEMVAGKSVSELSKMSGLDDFPLPTRVETLVRKKRVLKSTDEKENVKKGVSRSVTSLSAKSITSLSIPESLLTPLAVKSVVEDQDLVAKNKEIIKTKSVGELSHIGALSDFPIPDNVENLYNKLTATSSKRPAPAVPAERPSQPHSRRESAQKEKRADRYGLSACPPSKEGGHLRLNPSQPEVRADGEDGGAKPGAGGGKAGDDPHAHSGPAERNPQPLRRPHPKLHPEFDSFQKEFRRTDYRETKNGH